MTFLELINAVLIRLREDTIDNGSFNSDPYYRFIGSAVNDAKNRVQDAWNWSALRGTDYIEVVDTSFANLPNSENDSNYEVKRMYSSVTYDPVTELPPLRKMRQLTVQGIRDRYQEGLDSVPVGQPYEFAFVGRDPTTNRVRITLNPRVGSTPYALTVDRVFQQKDLVNATDKLLVPPLPVYTLATALASRERGEVGGTPVSELFAIADRHLSDAIATDSALFPNEMDWNAAYSGYKTNVRTAN